MKQINHIDFTETAFAEYLQWKEIAAPLDKMKEYLGKSAATEDDVTFSSKFQRPFNWHFYNNNKLIDNSWVPGSRTSENRVGKLVRKLDKYIGKIDANLDQDDLEDLLEVGGRIMHHIQDNSTPTHVVPIYHGPGLIDLYEVYGEIYAGKLQIVQTPAEADPRNGGRLKVCITPEEISRTIENGLQQPTTEHILMALYESSAQLTLQYIRESTCTIFFNGQEKLLPLTSFWREHNSNNEKCGEKEKMKNFSQGFGSFGILCNNFGKNCFTVEEDLYEIGVDTYLDIFKTLYKKSILDSIVVFEYMYRGSKVFQKDTFAETALSWN